MLENLIRRLPKTDLHVHLDGSLRLATLIELAKKQKITLPSYSEDGLKRLVFKKSYASLAEYLKGFAFTCAVMQDEESLERIAYELALDNFEEGVRYIEPRFAPQQHINPDLNMEGVLCSVNRGLERAKKEINSRKEIKSGQEPRFEYGIIGCAMRNFDEHFSFYYKNLINAHTYSPIKEISAAASLELVRALIKIRDQFGIPIVGFDLAGEEKGFPAEDHREAAHLAHKNFLHKTIHAGEAFGPPSIFQAVTELYADRLGHGTYLFESKMVDLPTKTERDHYTESLAQFVAERRITIEICLTSNSQTTPELRDLSKHPFKKMYDARLSTTFCTDNRLISDTNITNEITQAMQIFNLRLPKLKDIIAYGFKRSFYPGSYLEKRNYVRQVLDFYEKIESGSES